MQKDQKKKSGCDKVTGKCWYKKRPYLDKINNFKIWYEYEILGWPPILLGKKYGIAPARVCLQARRKRDVYSECPVPDSWLCMPRWKPEV